MSDQSTYPPATRTLPSERVLPQSDALAEAEPTSITDLFNRNPEGLSDRSIDAIIMEMRTLRVRLESTGSLPRNPRGSRTPKPPPRDPNLPPVNLSELFGGDDDDC